MFDLLAALAGYIPRDRVESILKPHIPLSEDGVALIADISGFTPLTEALTQGLSADQGAEELTHALIGVFSPLIEDIQAFRGSVIKFGGDALIVWYPREPRVRRSAVIRRAVTSAVRMQQQIAMHGQVPTPIGVVTLKMKIGLTYGVVKRFNLGLSEYGYEDVFAGKTLDRMAEAEHQAEPGEIILDADTAAYLTKVLRVREWRNGFAVLDELLYPARSKPWPLLSWSGRDESTLIDDLRPYVPAEIYETLATGHTQVAELKPVVSLFVQFQGIDYDADRDVEEKLQTYFVTAQQAVARYEGRLNRLITGDKGSLLHIIFGAPRTVEDQEIRAVRCALDLQQECGGLAFITMQRIGITVGRVFAGPVGSPYRHDYTTMGDSINLSARLMQNAADDQVLLEAAVRDKLGVEFEVTDLGQIKVKGKAQPIPVFAALSVQAMPERPAHRQALHTLPIFGRDEELALLRRRLIELGPGQGRVILLVGDVGMGKTLLLDTLRIETQKIRQVAWADGICLAYGQTFSGYLFIDLLHDLLELPPGADPDQTSQYLSHFCQSLFGQARLSSTYPYLARFMGLPLDDDLARRLEGLSGESLRWQLFELFHELIRLLLERHPRVLALDDLQWADPTSLQLVESLLPLVFTGPLILILAMRPEMEGKAWDLCQRIVEVMPEYVLEVTVARLDYTPASALIAYYAPHLPEPAMTYLIEKGGGNPLFLVELMRTLQAQGLLAEGMNLTDEVLDALALPDSVQGLLLAQIDRLAVEARHTLQMASVIGKTFFYKVLDALAAAERQLALQESTLSEAASERQLPTQLATLEAKEYILPDDPTDLGVAYTFRHILLQESAYSTLLYEHRRAYHRQVAAALERLFPAYLAEQAGLLAFHYERADDLEQAITYHLQAGDQARLLYANEEAEALYHKALKLLEQHETADGQLDLDRRAKTYLKIAQVRANVLDFEGAQEFYNQAFELLEQTEHDKPPVAELAEGLERVIRLGVLESGPTTLDPGLSEVTEVSEIIPHLFEGLVELDNDLNVIPAAARRWQVTAVGRQYRIELRPNLRWSDGVPLTAHDFVFAWRRNLQPETGAGFSHLLYGVEGAEAFNQGQSTNSDVVAIRALDDLNLEIILKAPTSYFPYLLASPITYPQPAHLIQANGADWAKPERLVCNGPFKIAEWQQGQEIRLEKNPFYRGFASGNLDQALMYFIYPGLDNYLNNEIDWCQVDDRADLPVRYPNEVYLGQYLTTYFLVFSYHTNPFQDRLIRQAVAYCVNQPDLVKEVWANVQRPAGGGIVPPGIPGHSPEIGLPFEPAMARGLFRQAGFTSGADLSPVTLAALPGFGATSQYLQASWREHLGLNIQIIEDMSFEDITSNLNRGAIHLALVGWELDYPDPDGILHILFYGASPGNWPGWQNQRFDQLIERASGLTNQTTRLALYHQADKLLVAEETAVIPLYYSQGYSLLRPGFRLEGAGKIIRGITLKLKNISVT